MQSLAVPLVDSVRLQCEERSSGKDIAVAKRESAINDKQPQIATVICQQERDITAIEQLFEQVDELWQTRSESGKTVPTFLPSILGGSIGGLL